jgi:hypothetical protein
MDGETSDESNFPSLDAMAAMNETIKSRPRGSSQNGREEIGAEVVTVGVATCVSAGMGVNVAGMIKAGWGVSDGRAVGGGGASTGIEQAARVKIIKDKKIILSFILASQ